MKKILILFVFVVFATQIGFCVDTSYIKTNQNKTTNYLANAVDKNGKIIKWDKKVINVYIKPCPTEKQKVILSAMYTYNNIFSSLFKFKQVKKPEEADITIEYTNSIGYHSGVSGKAAGLTTKEYYIKEKIHSIKTAKIQLLDSPEFTPSQLKGVIIHELGHAIGIDGHSLNPNDVMYPTTEGKDTFSKRDIETIKMIYKAEITTNKFKNSIKDQEAKNSEMDLEVLLRDTKGAPNNYLVWTNLGDFYYKNKNYNKALEAYQIALAKPNAPTSAINKRISYCYLGLGKKSLANKYMKASQK